MVGQLLAFAGLGMLLFSPAAPLTYSPIVSFASPPEQPLSFQILASWVTPQSESGTLLHVRVHLTARSNVLVKSTSFRASVNSPSGGPETVYGYEGPAPRVSRPNYLNGTTPNTVATPKPTIDPREDLGRQPLQIRAGDSVTVVVTFVVRQDATFDRNGLHALGLIMSR